MPREQLRPQRRCGWQHLMQNRGHAMSRLRLRRKMRPLHAAAWRAARWSPSRQKAGHLEAQCRQLRSRRCRIPPDLPRRTMGNCSCPWLAAASDACIAIARPRFAHRQALELPYLHTLTASPPWRPKRSPASQRTRCASCTCHHLGQPRRGLAQQSLQWPGCAALDPATAPRIVGCRRSHWLPPTP